MGRLRRRKRKRWSSGSGRGKENRLSVDNDTICGVCGGHDSVAGNEILICDGCDVGLHLGCYGLNAVPETDQWFCDTCRFGGGKVLDCTVCGLDGGVLKRSLDGCGWIHACCESRETTATEASRCEACGQSGATSCAKCDRAVHPHCVARSNFELVRDDGVLLCPSHRRSSSAAERKMKLRRSLLSKRRRSHLVDRRDLIDNEALLDGEASSDEDVDDDDDEEDDSIIDDSSLPVEDGCTRHRALFVSEHENSGLRGLGRGASRIRRGGVLSAALAHDGNATDFEEAYYRREQITSPLIDSAESLDSRYDDTDDDSERSIVAEDHSSDVEDDHRPRRRGGWLASSVRTPRFIKSGPVDLTSSAVSDDAIDLRSPSPLPPRPLPPRPLQTHNDLSSSSSSPLFASCRPPAVAPPPRLTEAQRLRIRENKQAALLRRHQRQRAPASSPHFR